MSPESTVCPLCSGDGYGIESDGLVTVQVPDACVGCAGTGTVTVPWEASLHRLIAAFRRNGWL